MNEEHQSKDWQLVEFHSRHNGTALESTLLSNWWGAIGIEQCLSLQPCWSESQRLYHLKAPLHFIFVFFFLEDWLKWCTSATVSLFFSDDWRYFLTLCPNSTSNNFLKFRCDILSETIKFFDTWLRLKLLVYLALWIEVLLLHNFVTSWVAHLENIGSLNYTYLQGWHILL